MTNRTENGKPENRLNLNDVVQKNLAKAISWFKTRKIPPEAFADVKINNKAAISASDAAMVAIYLYAHQLKKYPGYHAATYKTDTVEVELSQEADELFGCLNRRTLIAAIRKNPPSITFDTDECGFNRFDADLTGRDIIGEYKNCDDIWVRKSNNLELLLPYARLADSKQISNLISTISTLMRKWSMKGRVAAIVIRSALLLSDTDGASTFMEKHDMLDRYAEMRGTTAEAIRSQRAKTEIGSDGSLSFDL